MITQRWTVIGAAVVAALAILFTPATAQLAPEAVAAEANRLHDLAMVHDGTADFARMVQEHALASDLRLMDDPRAVECTRFQAILLHATGQPEEARREMERAAAIALARGEGFEAAMSLIDAAFIAHDAGDSAEAAQLATLAYRVTKHPSLTPSSRRLVLQRLPAGFAP
jgi:ATP/maltotriose-dependent transcriptional regulator MalT